jgi:hypothetical protein
MPEHQEVQKQNITELNQYFNEKFTTTTNFEEWFRFNSQYNLLGSTTLNNDEIVLEYVEKLKPFIVGFMTKPVGIYEGEPCISEFLKPNNPEDALRILKERNQKCILLLINPAYNGKVIEYIIRLAFI